jgi:hypothetical protein
MQRERSPERTVAVSKTATADGTDCTDAFRLLSFLIRVIRGKELGLWSFSEYPL